MQKQQHLPSLDHLSSLLKRPDSVVVGRKRDWTRSGIVPVHCNRDVVLAANATIRLESDETAITPVHRENISRIYE
jgi:hypothetical protein